MYSESLQLMDLDAMELRCQERNFALEIPLGQIGPDAKANWNQQKDSRWFLWAVDQAMKRCSLEKAEAGGTGRALFWLLDFKIHPNCKLQCNKYVQVHKMSQ